MSLKRRNFLVTVNCNEWMDVAGEISDHQLDWSLFSDEQAEITIKMSRVVDVCHIQYCLIGFEVGDGMNLHFHCYIELKDSMDSVTLANHFISVGFPHPHVDCCRGSREDNIRYVKKDGQFEEFGEPKFDQVSKRHEAVEFVKIHGYQKLVLADPELAMCCNRNVLLDFDCLKDRQSRRADGPVEVRWYFGAPGVGKSWEAESWISNDGELNFNMKQGDRHFYVQ
jgi:hypothetical protein